MRIYDKLFFYGFEFSINENTNPWENQKERERNEDKINENKILSSIDDLQKKNKVNHTPEKK